MVVGELFVLVLGFSMLGCGFLEAVVKVEDVGLTWPTARPRVRGRELNFGGILLLLEFTLAVISPQQSCVAASLSSVLWLEIVSPCITVASLGTFPFLRKPVGCLGTLPDHHEWLEIVSQGQQAGIKACASASISLLLSSALRR